MSLSASAQTRPAPPASPRRYVFENGAITGLDVALFNVKPGEVTEPNFANISYLFVHPRGTPIFDTGGIPDRRASGLTRPS